MAVRWQSGPKKPRCPLRDGRIAEPEMAFAASLEANTRVLNDIVNEDGFDALNEDQKDGRTAALKIALDKSRLGLAYIRLRLGKTEQAMH